MPGQKPLCLSIDKCSASSRAQPVEHLHETAVRAPQSLHEYADSLIVARLFSTRARRPFALLRDAVQYRLWKRHCRTSSARSAAPTPRLPPMRSIASSAHETARWPAPSAMWRRNSCCRFIRKRRSTSRSNGAPGAFRPPKRPYWFGRCRSNRAAPHPAWPPSPCSRSPGHAQAHACTAPTTCACRKATCTTNRPANAPSATGSTRICRSPPVCARCTKWDTSPTRWSSSCWAAPGAITPNRTKYGTCTSCSAP